MKTVSIYTKYELAKEFVFHGAKTLKISLSDKQTNSTTVVFEDIVMPGI